MWEFFNGQFTISYHHNFFRDDSFASCQSCDTDPMRSLSQFLQFLCLLQCRPAKRNILDIFVQYRSNGFTDSNSLSPLFSSSSSCWRFLRGFLVIFLKVEPVAISTYVLWRQQQWVCNDSMIDINQTISLRWAPSHLLGSTHVNLHILLFEWGIEFNLIVYWCS